MRCVVLHESDKRIRIRIPIINMTLRQADLLEYYIKSISEVMDASVDERTGNAVVFFKNRATDKRKILSDALSVYKETDESVSALVPEETGRALNRTYQEKLLAQVMKHSLLKIFLPAPVAAARVIIRSIPFIVRGIETLMSGKLKVEVLDGIAIASSVIRKDFETASSIIFLLNTGEILEEWTRKKSIGDLARTMSLDVDRVWLKAEDGEVSISISEIQEGDCIVVRSSDIIPLDGKVVEGEMTVNQSTMTGESEPVHKKTGGYVYAGTVVEEGECVISVVKTHGRGKYDQIVKMIEESGKLKSSAEAKAFRLADSLVPYSFAGFALTYALTGNAAKALSFLMVDFSCAMKLSMPLAVLSAIREAREHGICIKGGKFMEAVSEADTIVFDKTGTLTYAAPELVQVVALGGTDENEMLRIAACLEEHYPHSVARAIVDGARKKQLNHEEMHSKVEYIVAHGISSQIDQKKVVIGSRHFVMEDEKCSIPQGEEQIIEKIKDEFSKVYLAIDGTLTAVLCIFDPVRKEAESVICQLHKLGIEKICMMTGDNRKTAQMIAETLSLDEYHAEVLPEDKAAYIHDLCEKGHKVIMVGDGVNDSPALSEASVGIAVESGAAIAKEVADITISSENLECLVTLRKLSDALMKRIEGNYRFIIGFNSLLIALGIAGVIPPSASALMHNASTVMAGVKSSTNLLK